MTINLNNLSNFELNKLVIESYCAGQQITYEPQKQYCDITELMDDTCYFITARGSEQSFNYSLSENVGSFISEYKLNINHDNDNVTVSSSEYPEVEQITLSGLNYRKAICFIVIKIADRFKKKYTN